MADDEVFEVTAISEQLDGGRKFVRIKNAQRLKIKKGRNLHLIDYNCLL